jgi:hypothetical protein
MPLTAFRKVSTSNGSMYECTLENCTKRFTRRAENAKSHWLLHCQLRPYICTVCDSGYRRRHDLNRHSCMKSRK